MMLVVAIAAAVTASAAASASAPVNLVAPPIVIDLASEVGVPLSVVSLAIAETDAIFRSAGLQFTWLRASGTAAAVRVRIGNQQGPVHDGQTPLGWLGFENGSPTREIYLSYGNAERFMVESREIVGRVDEKTRFEREMLLARALGRALAHELGHYLLATKQHTRRGLLKGSRTAQELFGPERSAFSIDLAERRQIAARLRKESDLARRN